MLIYYTLNPVLLSILCVCSCICDRQKRNEIMMGMEELGGEELLLSHPDPVVLELNKLHNLLKEKDRELGAAQNEIKALRATEVLKNKAIEKLTYELQKFNEKLRFAEKLLDQKNLEIKKLIMEKKEALAAQFAAESTLRRVHANQKDDNPISIESIIAPLEANIKMYKIEIVALQEDKKALERHNKSKETALLETEEILRSALERALIVEDVQNHNFELKRQIEIFQEENRTLEKTTRQKVLEVEKLSETIKELEEVILDGAAPANAVRDYQRQIHELNEEKRTLERQLARVKVSANRVATVVANEWKDENVKVMPVKQWLEERRLLQAEMQRVRDKLVISERTAKAEAQIKDKLKMRLKTMEEGLKNVSTLSISPNAFCGSLKNEKSTHIFGFLSTNTGLKKMSTSQRRASAMRKNSPLQQPSVEDETTNSPGELKKVNSLRKEYGSGENLLKKSLWSSRSKVADSGEKENKETNENSIMNVDTFKDNDTAFAGDVKTKNMCNEESQDKESNNHDMVSGFLYDRLQKEVITLRRFCEVKDGTLNKKDEEIKTLVKKVDTLTRAIEVESKKIKREAATRKKEPVSTQMDDNKIRNVNSSKRGNTVMKLC